MLTKTSNLLHRAHNNFVAKLREFTLAPGSIQTGQLDQRGGFRDLTAFTLERVLEARASSFGETAIGVFFPFVVDPGPFFFGQTVYSRRYAVMLANAHEVSGIVGAGEIPVLA